MTLNAKATETAPAPDNNRTLTGNGDAYHLDEQCARGHLNPPG